MELLDKNNSLIDLKLVEDGEKKSIVDFIPDSEIKKAFGDECWYDGSNNQIFVPTTIRIDNLFDFFIKKGIFISILEIDAYYGEYNCIFENCHISESYGNGLFGDGSIEGGIIVTPMESPNAYWRGF